MKYKVYKYKEFARLLKDNGYLLSRQKGDHTTWTNASGRSLTITLNLNPMIARRLIKEYELVER